MDVLRDHPPSPTRSRIARSTGCSLAAGVLATALDGAIFQEFFASVGQPILWVKVIREPGARLISPSFDVAGYLLKCLGSMAGHSLMRENPYANLLFYGRYTERCRLPIHLRKENYETIRGQLDRVEVHTASLLDYLNEREKTVSTRFHFRFFVLCAARSLCAGLASSYPGGSHRSALLRAVLPGATPANSGWSSTRRRVRGRIGQARLHMHLYLSRGKVV